MWRRLDYFLGWFFTRLGEVHLREAQGYAFSDEFAAVQSGTRHPETHHAIGFGEQPAPLPSSEERPRAYMMGMESAGPGVPRRFV